MVKVKRSQMNKVFLLACVLVPVLASDYRTPAGPRRAQRTEEGPGTILPGGRLLSPYGREFTTGPGPFGLAVSPGGKRIVTSNGGLDRTSLSLLESTGAGWAIRTLGVPAKGKSEIADDDWKSTFMGLAFDGENVLYASEGESGQVRVLHPVTGRRIARLNLNGKGFEDSYSGDLAFDASRRLLYVVDQANFRVVIFDARSRQVLSSLRVGRLPFAMALSPDRQRLYVTNIGMFSYQPIPGAGLKDARTTGLTFPAFGFPSPEARNGVMRENASGQAVHVPGLGDPNVPESNSLCAVDVADPAHPRVLKFIRTGLPFGPESWGGGSPAGVIALPGQVFVSNSVNDSLSVIDPEKLEVTRTIELRIPGLETLRGILPIGLAYHAPTHRLLVAEAGINAVGVIDGQLLSVVGHIPAGWFPTRVAVFGDEAYVTNAKGHGTGPNATLSGPLPDSFQLQRRRGSLSRYQLPGSSELLPLTGQVMRNNGFLPAADAGLLPDGIKRVVVIVKENRTFDEVFGDMAGAPRLARYGRKVTPNHHAIARRFAMSDNFYADSEVSVDGHHWLVGSYPNVWTESSLMSSYAHAKSFRLTPDAPGRLEVAESNSSVLPEDQLEAGTLWHNLSRHGVTFRNFGEGFELAGVTEGPGLKPTGARYLTNAPMPQALYENTSRGYPNYNTNIPDQFRAGQFIEEIRELYIKPGRDLPQLIFIHLPQDHTAEPRPADGYRSRASYVADNDYALGRIFEFLSHTPWWREIALFVTEDDAAGGVDHLDSHRTLLLVAGPYAQKGYVAHANSSFPGMLKTVYRLLHVPPLNLYDAVATDLSECFTAKPDFAPYSVLPVNHSIFDPARAREPLDPKPAPKMDDPRELMREHRRRVR